MRTVRYDNRVTMIQEQGDNDTRAGGQRYMNRETMIYEQAGSEI